MDPLKTVIPFQRSNIATINAPSRTVFSFPSILLSKFVSIFTDLFCSYDSSLNILPRSNRLKMVWVNAKSYSAEVVYNKTIWNFSFMNFIGMPVRIKSFSTSSKNAIRTATARTSRGPDPTSVCFNYFIPKEVFIFMHYPLGTIKAIK